MTPNIPETERFVIPAAGLRVVDPATGQPLPAKGATVRGHAEHWVRRINEGDVAVGTPTKETARSTAP